MTWFEKIIDKISGWEECEMPNWIKNKEMILNFAAKAGGYFVYLNDSKINSDFNIDCSEIDSTFKYRIEWIPSIKTHIRDIDRYEFLSEGYIITATGISTIPQYYAHIEDLKFWRKRL
jgi:hypothetical protein